MRSTKLMASEKNRVATLGDLSCETGLCKATISHILNKKSHIYRYSEETQRKVFEAVEKLGYRSDSVASAMRRGYFNSVGLLLAIEENQHWMSIPLRTIEELTSSLSKRNLSLVMHSKPISYFLDVLTSGHLREMMVDGLIISCWARIPGIRKDIVEQTLVPVVWINANFAKNCVFPDDAGAGQMATEYLIRMGHRKIAYLDYNAVHYSSEERMFGYCRAMKKAGLSPVVISEPLPRDKRIERTRDFLLGSNPTTAIVAYSPSTALPVLLSAANRNGLRIPQDLSLITFGGSIEDSTGVAISTVMEPETEMGYESGQMLLRRMESFGACEPSKMCSFSGIGGATCAPPRKKGGTARKSRQMRRLATR